jgi:hypothetical protein
MFAELSFYVLPRCQEIGQHRFEVPVAEFTDAHDSGRLAAHKSELSFQHVDSHPVRPGVQALGISNCTLPFTLIPIPFATNRAILVLPVSHAPRGKYDSGGAVS